MFIVDFDIQANGDESFPFFWTHTDGSSVSMAGASMLMHVKKIRAEATASKRAVLEKTIAGELSTANSRLQIGDGVTSTFIITFPRLLLAPGRYAYDLVVIRPSSKEVVMGGTITVTPGVTEVTP